MVPFRLTTLDEVQQVAKAGELCTDFETDGFYGRIELAQFFQPDWPEVLMVRKPCVFTLFNFLSKRHIVAHNAHYEVTTMQQQTETRGVPAQLTDTFLLARLAYPQKEKFSLDEVMQYALGFDPYRKQGLKKSELQKSDWSKAKLSDEQLAYAATDVYYLPQVLAKVRKAEETFSYKLDMLTLRNCLDFQWNGIPVQMSAFLKKYEEVARNIKEWAAQCPVNVNSYVQVRAWLGVDASGDLDLAYMELDPAHPKRGTTVYYGSHPGMLFEEAAALIRKLRKERKKLSFLDKFERTLIDGVIYGKFKPTARSGRLTSDDQNLQQIPRSLKCVFGVEEDSGEIMLYSDYAQIELRHICAITKCKLMEQLFREGKDLHSYTTDMLFGDFESITKDLMTAALDTAQARRGTVITEEEYKRIEEGVLHEAKKLYKRYRQISKTCNFSLLYGGGITMFIGILIKTANILLTEVEANRTRSKWRNLWREVYTWQERGIAAWRSGRLGSTPAGRQYSAKMMTDQLNIENQGGAADVNKLALHYLMPKLRAYNEEHGTNYRMANNIHDSIILLGENKPEHYTEVGKILAREMQLAWFECSKMLAIKDLPMPVTVIAGYNWGDMENDDHPHPWKYELEPYAMLEYV